ncbi:hypothetical protein OHA61_39735 [Streptomyces sp. NBC_00885]|uniref:hypothetical protein n=1 Tax=Streptomyces sp. NBC_00885 TaxID=2975857 RepID=UPI0038673FFF|nr:hypothetical protein OHA61_00070 [Streptomyces sp. NBC_00885]WSY72139.1 hypothetical protein OHA61_39735 [Streptomyces sp. NBC_00885]
MPRVLGAGRITVGFGPAAGGHVMQFVRQLAGVGPGTEPLQGLDGLKPVPLRLPGD